VAGLCRRLAEGARLRQPTGAWRSRSGNEPRHLKAYQRLASRQVEARSANYAAQWWGWTLVHTLVGGAVLAAADLAFPVLTGHPFAVFEFICGFVGGVVAAYALSWRRYNGLSSKMMKADGPTMAEHRVSLGEEGIRSTSRFVDHV
jgi:hypothetical protein